MKRNYAMSYADNRFMNKGVEMQMDANCWSEAKRNYEYSCMLCCSKGVGAVQCAHCPIREAVLMNAQIFDGKLTKQDRRWVEEERRLL